MGDAAATQLQGRMLRLRFSSHDQHPTEETVWRETCVRFLSGIPRRKGNEAISKIEKAKVSVTDSATRNAAVPEPTAIPILLGVGAMMRRRAA
jgi:hypothetical protein